MGIGYSRVCLAGEDLDWTGGNSILLGIDLKTESQFLKNDTDEIRIQSDIVEQNISILIEDLRNYILDNNFFDYAIATLQTFHKKIYPLTGGILYIRSDIPVKSGLCSSAACIISIIRELCNVYELTLANQEMIDLAYNIEKETIGVVVGKMDYYSAMEKRLIYFNSFSDTINALDYSFDNIDLFLVDSSEESSSLKNNKVKYDRYISQEVKMLDYIQSGNILVNQMISAIENKDAIEKIGNIINQYQIIMREKLLVSTEKIDYIVDLLNENGAIGTKITGAGLGGYILSFIRTTDSPDIEILLNEKGIEFKKCNLL
jgi:mevalonate kinase